ncbi:MAG: hypothetical protein QM758_07735 [Armatimonas sp.]
MASTDLAVLGFLLFSMVMIFITAVSMAFQAATRRSINYDFLGYLWLSIMGILIFGLLILVSPNDYPFYEVGLSLAAIIGIWYFRYRKRQSTALNPVES